MAWENVDMFEVTKPGYFKRFVECADPESATWLGHVVAPFGCRLRRLSEYTFVAPHYILPQDTARALIELQAYYTQTHGDHELGELDGRVGDIKRRNPAGENTDRLLRATYQRKKT